MPKNKKQILSMRMFDSFKLQVDAYHLVLSTGGGFRKLLTELRLEEISSAAGMERHVLNG